MINLSGNVGKTTIARHLPAPRLRGSQVVSIESLNAGDGQGPVIRGRQFAELQEYLQVINDVVVDIGASNVEEMLAPMHRYRGSHEDVDCFVVPTVPARKQQQDTLATLAELSRLGVPARKVRLVFDMIDDGSDLERVVDAVLGFLRVSPVASVSLDCRLGTNEIYGRIAGSDADLSALAADTPTTSRSLLRPRTVENDWPWHSAWPLGGSPAGSCPNWTPVSRHCDWAPAGSRSRRVRHRWSCRESSGHRSRSADRRGHRRFGHTARSHPGTAGGHGRVDPVAPLRM